MGIDCYRHSPLARDWGPMRGMGISGRPRLALGLLLTAALLSAACDGSSELRAVSERAGLAATRAQSAQAEESSSMAAAYASDSTTAGYPSDPGYPGDPGARPLGSFDDVGPGDTCASSASSCREFAVTCPELQERVSGEIEVRRATAPARGVVAFLSSAGGGGWWVDDVPDGDAFFNDLRSQGLTVVQVRWSRGWLFSVPGEDAGTARLGCRPATAIRWVHDTEYAPLGLSPPSGRCGFCLTGNSGGASQIAYALAFYGLDTILDAVVPTSGPPHADQAKGCLHDAGEESYWYSAEEVGGIDASYGYGGRSDGPCPRHDRSWMTRWRAESVATGGADYVHPTTRVLFLLGGRDPGPSPAQAHDYFEALQRAGSPDVSLETESSMAHGLNSTAMSRLRAALLA